MRYQKPEDKLYIAQLYLPVIGQVHNIILILMVFLLVLLLKLFVGVCFLPCNYCVFG